jgi:PIN domain nuclease of toxin-antitoxin system
MASYVLDASALLVLLKGEPGGDKVMDALKEGAAISAINFSEVVAKLNESNMPEEAIHEALDFLELDIVGFDTQNAYKAGMLRLVTKRAGLSLGDRACLALAQQLNLPAITADRVWEDVVPDVVVQVIR